MAAKEDNCYDYLQPYMFEPKRNSEEENDSDRSWETCSSTSESNQPPSSPKQAAPTIRAHLEASEWCKCDNCQRQLLDVECVCCQELEKTKAMVKSGNVCKYLFLFTVNCSN